MAATRVVVPDIGDYEDIPVIEILVAPGETVAAEQSLVTLESDKATMDVPAPHAGVVGVIEVAVGDSVSQGSALLVLEVAAEDAETLSTRADERPAADADNVAAAASRAAQVATPGSPTIVCAGPDADAPPRAAPAPGGTKTSHASPTIRRFARTLGVDLASVMGTASKGRIQRTDVERYVRERLTQAIPTAAAAGGIAPIPAVDFSRFGAVETQPLSRVKRISGPFLQRAWLNIPHVTYQDEADITELEAFRQSLKKDPAARGVRMTPLPFFMKALCAALREFPVFNSSLSSDAQALVFKKYFHIGVAVDTPNGLLVPVLRDVDSKAIVDIAEELAAISARARDGKLKAEDMQGGCMSISSLGGIGGTAFTPIVNAPEVAILGIVRSRMTPIWDGTQFVPRLMLPLCLSFDHRVVDGAEAARFMSFLCACLSDVRKLLL